MVSPVPTGHNYQDILNISPHHKEQLGKKCNPISIVVLSSIPDLY